MIKSFRCKETEKLFLGRFSTKLPQAIQRSAVIKLKMLNAASILETLRVPPANNLEALHHYREGSTASGSISSGASALFGKAVMRMTSRSSITINEVTP